ncbi:Gag-Pol polyprotein [Bienertia sinuspersici]
MDATTLYLRLSKVYQSIMFMSNAQQIWKHLEQRFSVTNGARKYRLNRQIYETKQQGRSISAYFTDLKVLSEELEAVTVMPPLTEMNSEIVAYVQAQQNYQEEQKLFQFLKEASNMIQQEESQREIFQNNKEENAVLAMSTKKAELSCTIYGKAGHITEKCWACKVCGKGGHSVENCWNVKGFPPKYDKGKKEFGNKTYNPREKNAGDKEGGRSNQKWNKNKSGGLRLAGNVKAEPEEFSGRSGSSSGITAQQLEKLIKMLPSLSMGEGQDLEDDLEGSYSGMEMQKMMKGLMPLKHRSSINLPNGETSAVHGVGQVTLCSSLNLKDVMYIPNFKHNLLSI